MAEIASTPKRKRDDPISQLSLSTSPSPSKTVFSFQSPSLFPAKRVDEPTEDGSSSPRTKVAQRFRDLALVDGSREGATADRNPDGGGGGAPEAECGRRRLDHPKSYPHSLSRFDFDANGSGEGVTDMQLDPNSDITARKRIRTFEIEPTEPPSNDALLEPQPPADASQPSVSFVVDPAITNAVKSTAKSGPLRKSYPSINRLADSKSRGRRRAGTPPASRRKKSSQSLSEENEDEEEPVIVDPVRAALTWREDEITVYDPDDKDDDGTGINGVGFRPTPAVAYQRAQKRRQQLAEYKKREESDARARRNQRRQQQQGAAPELKREHSIVRVHFSDADTTVLTT